ncbi:hypothetical protein WA026_006163 [Henosepilachna vigintioctopunctata]|uniref:Tyrosine-protein kinase receptor n=1 Tax=Henosepilachna vigintioctopunctata TaxID=420089 RepID=A0AAW1TK08_9CUCU
MSCVTEEECRSSILGGRWVFQRYCIPRNTCLENYEFTEKTSPPSCVRCNGICNKTCKAISLSTKASIDSLKGCTHLVGNLELKISDIYVIDELERSLGDLKEIDGCLKVARSSAISSLRFLKNLKRITGRNKEKQCRNYTVFIYDNTNLKTLVEVDRIETSGDVSIGFHDNPELCVSEIRKFASKLGISNEKFDVILKKAKDVSPYSNGDKDPCADLQLSVTVTEYNPTNVTLQWESYKAENVTVIGYTIFYILASDLAAERTNDISSNMCENNGWKSRFVSNNSRTVQLTQLYPFSLYIYWIKVYHIQDEMSGIAGSTEKKSFTTLQDDPSEPVSFDVTATSPTTINITWETPYHINGNLSHYQLVVLIEKDDPKFVSRRNYCMYPHIDTPIAERTKEPIKNWLNTSENGSCQCVINIYRLNERFCGPLSDGFSFSNDDCNRFLYQIMDKPKNITKRYLLQDKSQPKGNPNNTVVDIQLPANKTNFVLQHLKAFTKYLILFSACNQKFKDKYQCSAVLLRSERTKANVSADRISNLNLKVLKNEEAILSWDDPPNPNSMIVAYNIEYKSGDSSQAVSLPAPDCITRTQHINSGRIYRITYIDPGVYSIRVRPISLYGVGLYSNPVTLRINSPLKTWLIYLFVCIVFVFFVVIIIVYLWYKRKKTLESIHLITSINPDYASAFYVQDDWEVDRNDVEITDDLGEGSFGVVRFGYIKSKKLPCAVKTIGKDKSLSYKTEFLNEASIMKQFSGGYHVVKLYGVVSISDPPLVLMELMERGDLKEYLRIARESSRGISSPELYQMAAQIADGMSYLSAKKFVHRDLAARNCMVAADKTVKIGDFGMTKDIYMHDYYRKGTTGLLPVRWMAPKA